MTAARGDGAAAAPLVSVVVCAFNAGRFLRPALASVLAQTWPNLEVLLVDDGSTDGSVDALPPDLDPRLRILRQANAGKSVALNRALDELRGEFYALHDADDLCAPNRIAEQANALLAHPELAAVFCGFDLVLGDRHAAPRFAPRSAEQCRRDIDGFRMPGHDPTAMYRVAMVRGLRYDEALRVGQGFDYILRVGERWPMQVVGGCLYSYRIGDASQTRRDPLRRAQFVRQVLDKAAARRGVPAPPLPPVRSDNNLAAQFMESAVELRSAGRWREAVRTGWQCWRLAPADPHHLKALVYAAAPRALVSLLRRRVRAAGSASGPSARGRAFALVAAAVAVLWIAVLSLTPYLPGPQVQGVDRAPPLGDGFGWHFAAFAALGVAVGAAWPRSRGRALLALVGGCALLELLQLLSPGRHALWFDALCNSLAAVVGYPLGQRLAPHLPRLQALGVRPWRWAFGAGLVLATATAVAANFGYQLSGWSADYALRVGNELGDERPWHGALGPVALYPTALDLAQAQALYRGSREPDANVAQRRALGAVALWTFAELAPPVSDRVGALALDGTGGAFARTAEGLARIDGAHALQADASRAPLTQALTASPALSVELWAAVDDVDQHGPARLITFSFGPYLMNLTVGQEGDAAVFRVQCPAATDGPVHLQGWWNGVFRAGAAAHLLFTYDRGVMHLYRDGVESGEPYSLLVARAAAHEVLGSGPVAAALLWFAPLGLLLALGWRPWSAGTWLLGTAVLVLPSALFLLAGGDRVAQGALAMPAVGVAGVLLGYLAGSAALSATARPRPVPATA